LQQATVQADGEAAAGEVAADRMPAALWGADPDLIRNIYRGFGIEGLNDDECQAYPFVYRMYSHVSRMYFILSAKRSITASVQTYGMSSSAYG
jgi:hypothetical protein